MSTVILALVIPMFFSLIATTRSSVGLFGKPEVMQRAIPNAEALIPRTNVMHLAITLSGARFAKTVCQRSKPTPQINDAMKVEK